MSHDLVVEAVEIRPISGRCYLATCHHYHPSSVDYSYWSFAKCLVRVVVVVVVVDHDYNSVNLCGKS